MPLQALGGGWAVIDAPVPAARAFPAFPPADVTAARGAGGMAGRAGDGQPDFYAAAPADTVDLSHASAQDLVRAAVLCPRPLPQRGWAS